MATATAPKYKIIDRDALKAKIDKKERFTLWNTLSKEYYKAEANIPGSKWVPVDKVSEQAKQIKDKKEPIVTYCGGPMCPASKQAAEKLAALGFTNVSAFEGGLQEWSEAELPLVKL